MHVGERVSLSWMLWSILWCSIEICWSLTCRITKLLSSTKPGCSYWLLQPQWVQLMHVGELWNQSWMLLSILWYSIVICLCVTCRITKLLSSAKPGCSSWLLQPQWVQLMHVGERVSPSWMLWSILWCSIEICWSITFRNTQLLSSSKFDSSTWLLEPNWLLKLHVIARNCVIRMRFC